MKSDEQVFRFDVLKWCAIVILIALGVFANYHFVKLALVLRVLGWIILLAIAFYIASQTAKGSLGLSFVRAARNEMRKVTWPTRHETTQTTMIVIAAVIIMALVLWVADTVLMKIIGLLTGQGG